MLGEVTEVVKTGVWVGDCFLFTNNLNRLNYYVGGEIVTVAHLEKALYLLGYLSDVNRVFLADKELNVISYALELSVLQYQDSVTKRYKISIDHVVFDLTRILQQTDHCAF